MIHYSFSPDPAKPYQQQLEEAIELEKPGWLKRARKRTDQFIQHQQYDESSSIWSEIKAVFMKLQRNKCAYCERKLASPDFSGTIDHDVEHYRPKSDVQAWPTLQIVQERGLHYNFATGAANPKGYYWLAYEPRNYCTACKKCNTTLKSTYFPVPGNRGPAPQPPDALNAVEKPFLIHPLGDLDEDPMTIIDFVGITAIPVKQAGDRFRRARVTIDFFELNHREELRRERAEQLVELDNALAILESNLPQARKQSATKDIARLQRDSSAHASCVRAACKLYIDKPLKMRQLFQEARDYLDSLD